MRAAIWPWSWPWLLPIALALWPSTTLADDQADYFVRSLPGAPSEPQVKMHAGWVQVLSSPSCQLFLA